MSSPWKKVSAPADVQNLSDIMSEEYAKGLQIKEEIKFAEEICSAFQSDQTGSISSDDIPPELLKQIEDTNVKDFCDSDAIIAKVLQCQFDKEYDDEIKRVEKKRNGEAKVSISYENYRNIPEHLLYDSESDDEETMMKNKKDWDRFETNEKEFASLPKRGFIMKDGKMVTKHDSVINGRRNACRVMAFPPEVCTGDGAGFDMKLSNSVFNHLREHTRHHQSRKHKMLDRKESQATAEMGLDEPTRLILFKLINNGLLEDINGIISTGKESIVLHANGDTSYPEITIPKECAIKVFKTTLNEFKTRDKYIEADYRFKDRFSKQNPRKIVHMWAEKEMHNMIRMQKIGLNCPEMICLKKHILVMSFIGRDNKPAPKLRDVIFKPDKWQSVYKEVVESMHKLYNVGHMIHADLSEYNILWWENKCWFIDVSQSVQPDHPNGLEFLLRDCRNISNFFEKKGVADMKTAEDLFKSITGFDEVDVNLLEGVHTIYNSLSSRFEIAPDDNRNISYPFEYCWQKTNEGKQVKSDDSEEDEFDEMWAHSVKDKVVDTATNFGNVLNIIDEASAHEDNVMKPIEKDEVCIVDKNVIFANELKVTVPADDEISSCSKEKKSFILVMSFIGRDNKPAPKLRDVIFKPDKWQSVYKEVVESMHKLYNVGHMIHADLSEYNILWWENKCWFIDVSQSVQPDHPNGLEFLLRDCRNISNFFEKKGVADMKTAEDLFKSITGFDEVDVNLLEGVHTIYNSLSSRFEIAPDDNRNISYPFEYCWQKTNEGKQVKSDDSEEDEFDEMWAHSVKDKVVDTATNFGNVLNIIDEASAHEDNVMKPIEKDEVCIVDKNVIFANELKVTVPADDEISSCSKEKKS